MAILRKVFLAAAVLAACAALVAQQPPAAQKPAAEEQKKPDYSQEPFVIEQMVMRARFEKAGTGMREMMTRVRVQSEAGVQQLGQLIFGYNSANEAIAFEYVRVRKADGSVVTAGAGDIQDLTGPVAREAPVYTDYRQKHVTVPGLRPGEILEYRATTKLHTPLAPGHFWMQHDFVKSAIVLDEQVEISVPREVTLKLKTHPGREPQISEADGRRIYRWKSENLKREPEEGEEEEEEAPKKKGPKGPAIELTTFQSWEELGKWYAGLERERAAPSETIRAKALELIRERPGEIEKIRAIYDFVAQNFRYVSLSFGVGRYQPHAAADVFANQYGDCKDKHTLLEAMLRAAGLRAYPVLIHSSRKLDPEMPSPTQFDHVISAVALGNEMVWMDTTTEIAPFRLLSAPLRNKQALLVTPEEPARLVTTPADPPFASVQDVTVEGEISELGKLTAKVHYTLRGDSELLLRMAFRRTPRNQWKQLAQLVAYGDGLRGEVTEVTLSEVTETEKALTLELQISQPNFLDWSNRRPALGLPMPALGLPQASPEAETDADAEPIELGAPIEVTNKLKLQLPAKYTARAPVPVGVTRDYAEYRSKYSVEGQTITAERTTRFRLRELPAARARDLMAFSRAVRADEAQTFQLESSAAEGAPAIPEGAKADELLQAAGAAYRNENYRLAAELLRRVVTLEPKHKTAWLVLGTALFAQQNYDGAVEAFQKQAELNPYDENAQRFIGLSRWRQQKHAEAEEAFRKQLEVNPLDKQAQSSLAQMLVDWRKYKEAVPELEKAISLQPGEASLHVSLGRARLETGESEKALAAFDKAVELSPEPMVWNNVAYYLTLNKSHLDRAQQYAESAVAAVSAELRNVHLDRLTTRDLQRVSSLAAYWDTLGWVHFQRGDMDKAEKYVRAAWLLDFHGEVGDHLGQIYEKRGEKQKAIEQYALALAATRPEPETRGRMAKLAGESKVESLVAQATGQVNEWRTVRFGFLLKEKAEAEVFVLLAPAPDGGTMVEAVRFASGNEKLRALANELKKGKYNVLFPDQTQTRLVRRGKVSCTEASGCVLVLQTADSVTSVD